MSRGIDHLVLAARDLSEACGFYERLGFKLTPQAQHPFGTGNRLAQLKNDFLEILSVTSPEDLIEHSEGFFSFGAHNRDYLERCEGMSMIALKSDGWEKDRQTFKDAGFDLPKPFTFSRLARQPDGGDVKVGFDLTFVPDAGLPDAVFFTCDHQHQPEYFYKPEFQKHANGALAVDEVIMMSNDLTGTNAYLSRLYGIEQPVSVLTTAQLEDRFPGHETIDISGDAVFAGYRIGVLDLGHTRSILESNAIDYADKESSIWLYAFGTIIEFSDHSANESMK